jgi:hypothetical protein
MGQPTKKWMKTYEVRKLLNVSGDKNEAIPIH